MQCEMLAIASPARGSKFSKAAQVIVELLRASLESLDTNRAQGSFTRAA